MHPLSASVVAKPWAMEVFPVISGAGGQVAGGGQFLSTEGDQFSINGRAGGQAVGPGSAFGR